MIFFFFIACLTALFVSGLLVAFQKDSLSRSIRLLLVLIVPILALALYLLIGNPDKVG